MSNALSSTICRSVGRVFMMFQVIRVDRAACLLRTAALPETHGSAGEEIRRVPPSEYGHVASPPDLQDRRAQRVHLSRAGRPGSRTANATCRVRQAVGSANHRSTDQGEAVLLLPCGWKTVNSNSVAARQQPIVKQHRVGYSVACPVLSSKAAPDGARVRAAVSLDVVSSFHVFG